MEKPKPKILITSIFEWHFGNLIELFFAIVRAITNKNFKFSSKMVTSQQDESSAAKMHELNKNSVIICGETLKIIL